jgi:hypothetical protein
MPELGGALNLMVGVVTMTTNRQPTADEIARTLETERRLAQALADKKAQKAKEESCQKTKQ